MTTRPPHRRGAARALAAVAAAIALAGCLGEPEIEDRWTLLEHVGSSVAPGAVVPANTPRTYSMRTAITYRRIVTGFAVTELRASPTLTAADLNIHPTAPREPMAYDIDRLLAGSVSLGRATRAVTGWDHLIQELDLAFTATVPAMLDSAGVPVGAPAGLFLVTYLGSGVEIERADGTDTLIVTPFPSGPSEILPVGLELAVGPPTP